MKKERRPEKNIAERVRVFAQPEIEALGLELWDIAFESHIYANGPHGLTTGDPSVAYQNCSGHYAQWVEDSIAWLRDVLGGAGD